MNRTGRELPEDLRDYRAPEGDGFQLIAADMALMLLALVGLFCLLFLPELVRP